MIYKWIGSFLIVTACGSTGFRAAAQHRREIRMLRSLVAVLDWMNCELSYHLTHLPELCRKSAAVGTGEIRAVLLSLAKEMEQQTCPDVISAMSLVLQRQKNITRRCQNLLLKLGTYLGRFDLAGQLSGIASIRECCLRELAELDQNREQRIRSYQTLGLCAGAALVILLI